VTFLRRRCTSLATMSRGDGLVKSLNRSRKCWELGSYIPATVQWANPGLRPWSPYPVGCCSASVTWGLILPLLGYASRQEGSVAEVLSLE